MLGFPSKHRSTFYSENIGSALEYERVVTAGENDLIMLLLILPCSDIVLPHRY